MNEPEPETDEIVCNSVQAFFAFFQILFSDWNFSDNEIQFLQSFEILCQPGLIQTQGKGYLAKLSVSGCNGFDQGKVSPSFAEFFFQ